MCVRLCVVCVCFGRAHGLSAEKRGEATVPAEAAMADERRPSDEPKAHKAGGSDTHKPHDTPHKAEEDKGAKTGQVRHII